MTERIHVHIVFSPSGTKSEETDIISCWCNSLPPSVYSIQSASKPPGIMPGAFSSLKSLQSSPYLFPNAKSLCISVGVLHCQGITVKHIWKSFIFIISDVCHLSSSCSTHWHSAQQLIIKTSLEIILKRDCVPHLMPSQSNYSEIKQWLVGIKCR